MMRSCAAVGSRPRASDRQGRSWGRRATTLLLATTLCSGTSLALADPAAPASKHELHAAQCVAALEVNTEDLAAQVKAGDESVRPLLQSRLESGTAFVGDVYLHDGTDEAKARALANDALEAQKGLNDAQLAARQSACAEEGAKLLAASNGIERAIVQRLARKRMAKLLAG